MSSLVGGAGAGFGPILMIQADADSVLRPAWFVIDGELGSDLGPTSYANDFWPRGAGLIGDLSVDVGLLDGSEIWYHRMELVSGQTSAYSFAGVTRDAYGSPLGGATVKLYHTADDVRVDASVSDASGNYVLYTPYYPDAHYIVMYKVGVPDLMGTTVNTLIGS